MYIDIVSGTSLTVLIHESGDRFTTMRFSVFDILLMEFPQTSFNQDPAA